MICTMLMWEGVNSSPSKRDLFFTHNILLHTSISPWLLKSLISFQSHIENLETRTCRDDSENWKS